MSDQYDQSSQQFGGEEDADQYQPTRKRLTKNQQIYGDFVEAYEPEVQPAPFSKKSYSYGQFKAGSTIQTYSSEIQVDLPKKKPKPKVQPVPFEQDQEDDKPMLGQFTLNSFLNQFGKDDLNQIEEQQNQESQPLIPVGLNDKILEHLELIKIGQQQQTEQAIDLDKLSFERYMKLGKPNLHKVQPKYKTQQQKQLAKFYSDGYGVGFKMMEKMGFKNINKGLGKNETGTHKPVEAVLKTAFTMKDETEQQKRKRKQSSDDQKQGQEQEKEISIPEQLFKYKSKNHKINNFLLDLQRDYEKIRSQMYFLQNQVQSMKNKTQITMGNSMQQEKQAQNLRKQIEKLSIIGSNIQKCDQFPHLGEHYQVDMLFVKNSYDKLKSCNFDQIHQIAQIQITKLKSSLNKFYLAKSRQTMKSFQQSTAIEEKIHKNISKKRKKNTSNVIDLDKLSDDSVEILTIGVQEEQKIRRFMSLIITKTIIPIVQNQLKRIDSLDKIKDSRIIDLIDIIKKFEDKPFFTKKIVDQQIYPMFLSYVRKINLVEFQTESSKLLPHHVILPWLHLLKINQKFSLLAFYKQIVSKLWNIQNSTLYNIVTPFVKFSSTKEINYFVNLYLAPRILNQLENFSLNSPNPILLNGFAKYSQFLKPQIKEEILENTLFLQVQQAFEKYKTEKEAKELQKWLSNWKKFSDRVSAGKFEEYFKSQFNYS